MVFQRPGHWVKSNLHEQWWSSLLFDGLVVNLKLASEPWAIRTVPPYQEMKVQCCFYNPLSFAHLNSNSINI